MSSQKSKKVNWENIVQIIMVGLIGITFLIGAAWVMSPEEFTIKFETDENTLMMLNQTIGFYEEEKDCGTEKMINTLENCDTMIIYDGTRTVSVINLRCLE